MSVSASLLPFAAMPALTPDALAPAPVGGPLPVGDVSAEDASLELDAVPLQLDGQLQLDGLSPEEAKVLLADLLQSFEGGAELADELDAMVAQLQAVAEASAQSPLLDPAASQLGHAPRIRLEAVFAPPDVDMVEGQVVSPTLELPLDVEPALPVEPPIARVAGVPEAPAALPVEVPLEPVHLAEFAVEPVVAVPEAVPQPAPVQSAAPTAQLLQPVPVPVEASVVATVPGEVGSTVLPQARVQAGPAAVQPTSVTAPVLPESVQVLSRSPVPPVAPRPAQAPAVRPVSSGTFDGTPWLITADDSRVSELLQPQASEPDVGEPKPESAHKARSRVATQLQRSPEHVRAARPTLSAATTAPTAADGSTASGAADVATLPSTDVTRPAMSAVRSTPLSAQLSQAAHASAPEAPVTVSDRPLSRVDLRVQDGDRSMRLGVAREAEGYAVEVRAPRDVVAEIRDLEADVDAALREDGGEGLASFDASAEDEAFDSTDLFEPEADAETATLPATDVPIDSSRLLDRRA